MNFKFVKRGLVIATIAAAIIVPAQGLMAADAGLFQVAKQEETNVDKNCLVNAVAEVHKEQNSEKTIKIETKEEMQFNQLVAGKVFVNCEEGFAYAYAFPQEDSDWCGKIYPTSVVKILERGETWSEIQSGNVVGYVKTADLITGKDASLKVQEFLTPVYSERNVLTLSIEEIDVVLSVGETREEEVARLAAEEEARIAAEKARVEAIKAASRKRGEDLVSYAKQFVGNPYVYGGTSLTRGADCSGFVMSVYKRYGVSLPHSSYGMRKVGRSVSYSEIQLGDIICYSGHVGIYAGNGKIVNALNENKGIVISDAKYKNIITIRRIF